MPASYDISFAKIAVQNGLLSPEQAQAILKSLASGKILAQTAVEAKLLTREQAAKIIEAVNRKGTSQHPALPRSSGKSTAIRPATAVRKRTESQPAVRQTKSLPAVAARKASQLPFLVAAAVLFVAAGACGIYFVVRPKPAPPKENPAKKDPPKKDEPSKKDETVKKEGSKKEDSGKKDEPRKDTDKEAFLQRLAQKRREAEQKLGERKAQLKEERDSVAAERKKLRERMATKRLTVKLASGQVYVGAVLTAFSFDEIQINDAATVPWILVTPESTLEVAKAVFSDRPYERGRFLTARKLWKEAMAAFEEASRKEEDRRSKIEEILPILDKLLRGEGSFRGSARRVGQNGILLSYDFQDAAQAEDFQGRASSQIQSGRLELPEGISRVTDLEFTTDLDVEMKVKTAGKLRLGVQGLLVEVGPESRLLGKDKKELAKGVGLKADVETRVRLQVRGAKIELYLGADRAFVGEVPTEKGTAPPIGTLSLGVAGGTARLSPPLTIRGAVDPKELEKRFAEVEILVHRATSDKLDDIRTQLEDQRAEEFLGKRAGYRVEISAHDPYFVYRIQDLASHDTVKGLMKEFLQTRIPGKLEESLDALLAKHPDVPGLHYFKGRYLQMTGDTDEARKSYREALKHFPEFFEALTGLAEIHLYEDEYDEGLPLVEKAVRCRPDYAPAYAMRAVLRFAKDPRNLTDAIRDDLDLARVLDPGDDEIVDYRRAVQPRRTYRRAPGLLGFWPKAMRIVTKVRAGAGSTWILAS